MQALTLAGAALNTTPLDWRGNLEVALQAIEQARAAGVHVLVLPELCLTGYGCEDQFYSDALHNRALRSLRLLADATAGMAVAVGLPLAHEGAVYDCAALVVDGRVAGFVPKQHLTGEGIHYEPRWFRPWQPDRVATYRWGEEAYPIGDLIFELDGVRLAFEICEDAWAPDRPALRHARRGVDVILNPSASHFAFGKTSLRRQLVREASRAHRCAYVYASLLGNEAGRIIYDGEVLIAQNEHLLGVGARLQFQPVVLTTATIDVAAHRKARRKTQGWGGQSAAPGQEIRVLAFNWAATQTPPSHPLGNPPVLSKHEELHRAIALGLWDYLRKSHSRGFTVSLSGGADSSACFVLAAEALRLAQAELGARAFQQALGYAKIDWGKPLNAQLLRGVYQATAHSGEATEASAQMLAESLGASFTTWEVQTAVEDYVAKVSTALGRPLAWATDDHALQNIQSRVRAPGIWLLANATHSLLLTTSNRSEAAVGYATMDGDTAGGVAPVAGIDKATLLQWLKWAEVALQLPGLRYVNQLQPTAELRPPEDKQTDEADLMPYPVLDAIERSAIHNYRSPLETFRHLRGLVADADLHQYVTRFFQLWARNQWKRERYAPSFHLDDANLDPRSWCRFPILSGGFVAELQELDNFVAQRGV